MNEGASEGAEGAKLLSLASTASSGISGIFGASRQVQPPRIPSLRRSTFMAFAARWMLLLE
jgi:hypothetical protein